MADTWPMNDSLCGAYRALLVDKIGVVAGQIATVEKKVDLVRVDLEKKNQELEVRVRALENHKAEQIGMTRGQATLWGLGIAAVTAVMIFFIERWLAGGFA